MTLIIGLVFCLTFFTWGAMAIFQVPGASTDPEAPAPKAINLIPFIIGGFSPSIAGIITALVTGGRSALKKLFKSSVRFSFGLKYYLIIILIPVFILGFRLGLQAFRNGEFLDSALIAQPVSFIGFTIQILFLGPLSEEFGWRGVALEALLEKCKAVYSSLLLGVIWAVWHLPLFYIKGTTQYQTNFWTFSLSTIGFSFIFAWLFERTDSILHCILFHAAVNAVLNMGFMTLGAGTAASLIDAGSKLVIGLLLVLLFKGDKQKNRQKHSKKIQIQKPYILGRVF